MLDFMFSVAVVVATAWIGRIFLDARELGWGRVLLAALIGIGIGDATALFLMVADVSEIPAVDFEQLQIVSLPFRVIATMGAIVVLELVFQRRRGVGGRSATSRDSWSFLPRRRRFDPTVVFRALQVSRILARHGLGPLVDWGSGRGRSIDSLDLARRARSALEEAGGLFIKLGQLLATRPDLLPPAAMAELSKLQSAVAPVGREAIEAQMAAQLGRPLADVFAKVDWQPLGSASIAQAHAAELLDGTAVVVKVRRPGLEHVIERDLAIVRRLARSAQLRFAWAKKLRVVDLAAEFAQTLLEELDLEQEARHIDEVATAVSAEPLVHVPSVFHEFTRPGLLVMKRLAGTPLANLVSGTPIVESRALADALCTSQVTSMLQGERFHGDPHPGNVLLLDDGRLGLIDLGISSKLDTFERAAVFQMLLALHQQQPSLLFESMVTVGAIDPSIHDPEEVERALARFMSAYLGPGLPPAKALTDLLRLTVDLGLLLPPSTTAMFRALSTLMGTLERLDPGYPAIDAITELGGDEFKRRLLPTSAAEFVKQEWSELGPLMARLPRHIDRLATMLEHGSIATTTRVLADANDRAYLERLLNRFVFTLLSIGTAAVSVMLLDVQGGLVFPWFELGLYEVLGWIGLFIAMTLMFRVLLAVLRSDSSGRERDAFG